MSDKPISKGDLVMVVRSPHDCTQKYLGRPMRVNRVHLITSGVCTECAAQVVPFGTEGIECDGETVLPREWLKRLDPDALKDDVPASEELTV